MADFDLVEHTKTAARDALNSLDSPDDDILPVLLAWGPRGLALMGAPMPADDDGKDSVADAMTARIAIHQATEASLVVPAYVTLVNPEAGTMDRQETVVLIHITADGTQNAWSAKVTRHDNRPPDMSLWEPMGDGQMAGRFCDAITLGLKFARSSYKDAAMVEILEQGHREGKVDELVAMFLAAKEALIESQKGNPNVNSNGNA